MNSYKHSHISGVLLSLTDNGGDYFLLAHTVRNVCEWIASQATLPNNLELPCHLPLPIPAFNVDNPLQLNTTTGKYFQPNRNMLIRFIHRIHLFLTQRIVDPYRVWMLHIEVLLDGDVQR